MPTYFYNVHNVQPSTDHAGVVLKDDEAAWKEATLLAGDLFKDIDGKFRPGQEWTLEVTDEQRRPLYFIVVNARKTK
jgi:hypothetical protein